MTNIIPYFRVTINFVNFALMKKTPAVAHSGRQSNMELLRIVSMLMVLSVHIDGASLGLPELGGDLSGLTSRSIWQLAVESFAIIGVNCFTLISGYFGIRLRLRNVLVYLFQCVFYAVGIYTVVNCLLRPGHFSWSEWGQSWMVLTHTDLWYVPAYFCLMLLSPFLNAGFDALSRRRALWVTLGFVAFNVWAGWWWGDKFNPTGYTVTQLVMMYMIGRCVAAYSDVLTRWPRGRVAAAGLSLYVVLSVLIALHSCFDLSRSFAYNSPLVIMSSISLLTAFAAMRFSSNAVNYIARSAFAVYLLHKAPSVWVGYMKPTVVTLWHHTSLIEFSLWMLVMMAMIYLLAMVIDSLRRVLSSLLFRKRDLPSLS